MFLEKLFWSKFNVQIRHWKQKTNKKGFVIDGRDIGSVVFKNADLKLFIEVKPNVRAKRRHKQLIDLGEKSIYAEILKEIKLRDRQDIIRKNSPLIDKFILKKTSHFYKILR